MQTLERRLLSEEDAAAFIGMSRSFLRQSRCYGNRAGHTAAPPYIKIGKAVRYDIADLEAWINANRHTC